MTDDLAGDKKKVNFYIVVWSIDAEICNRIIKVGKYTYVSESTSRNCNRGVKRMVSVGGIDIRLLPRSQNISEHTGKMKGRTEDVRREWQEDKEQDLIHKLFREGDTKTQRETQICKGRLDRMKRQKITITVNSRSTLKSEKHIQKPVHFPQSRDMMTPLQLVSFVFLVLHKSYWPDHRLSKQSDQDDLKMTGTLSVCEFGGIRA